MDEKRIIQMSKNTNWIPWSSHGMTVFLAKGERSGRPEKVNEAVRARQKPGKDQEPIEIGD